jgi:glucosamine-6-phosphate deaminase
VIGSVLVHPVDGWADAVAAELIGRLRATPRLRLVLPTGETPAPLYRALVRDSPAGLWADATVILLDEYVGLGADDPAAGGPRLRRELVDHVRPGSFVDVDPSEPDSSAATLDAAAVDLDLAVVGLGLNGHIGLNEPGSDAASPTRVVELHPRSREAATAYGAVEPPRRGITLGLARLLEAGELWLLVTGERKAAILRDALEGPETPDVPASFLRRHPRLRVLADEPAASLLSADRP